jgi:uncharacterized SAM-binding protein YcdF (DUF218 family)
MQTPALIKALVLPPASLLVLALIGWLMCRRWPRAGRAVTIGSLGLLALMSLPVTSGLLRHSLERGIEPVAAGAHDGRARAIVVLSAGLYRDAPEYGDDTVATLTLERLRYGAWLHRETGLPLLVTGGSLHPGDRPLAEAMAETLANEFGVTVQWVEPGALNTWQNATLSAAILRAEAIGTVYLVTSAWHMPRSLAAFEAAGLDPVMAPTGFQGPIGPELIDFVPSAFALAQSTFVIYEWIGIVWYEIAYY